MKRVNSIADFPKEPHYIVIEVLKYESSPPAVVTNHPIFVTTDKKDLESSVKEWLMKKASLIIFDRNGSCIPTLELNLNLKEENMIQKPVIKTPEIQIHEE